MYQLLVPVESILSIIVNGNIVSHETFFLIINKSTKHRLDECFRTGLINAGVI